MNYDHPKTTFSTSNRQARVTVHRYAPDPVVKVFTEGDDGEKDLAFAANLELYLPRPVALELLRALAGWAAEQGISLDGPSSTPRCSETPTA
jgi:hypothetical protein